MDSAPPENQTANVDRVKMVVYTKSTAQPPVMAALVQQLEAQKGRLEYEVIRDGSAVLKSVEQTTMTVLILTLHQKEELVEVLNVLTQVQGRIQSGLLRAMVLNGMNHPRVIALLKSKGVQEIMDFNTNIKALNHKIKGAFLVVTQAFQRIRNQNIRPSTVVGGDAAASRGRRPGRNDSSSEVQWEKPVEHACDVWWIPSTKNLRNVMGRWLMDILGPGPAAGVWEEATFDRGGERGWIWKPRVSTDTTFMPKPGRWIFFGRQPEFVWQKNLWAFVAKNPYLAYYAEGSSESEYVRIDSPTAGKLKVYENSETARGYLPKIQASLEASLKLSKADGAANEIRGNFDPGTEDGSVGAMDFVPSGASTSARTGGNYSASLTPDEEPADWNNHTGAVGFGFRAKDLRIDQNSPRAKWRNALAPEVEMGAKLGLEDVKQAGIVAGTRSFDRLILELVPFSRNGVEMARKEALRVIELTVDQAALEFPAGDFAVSDKFLFKVEFRLGDVEKKFDMEWAVTAVQAVEGAGCLVQGSFTGGDHVSLAEILKLVMQRQLELKDFFLVAKGA
ncbi:MAG: hypothetical protein JST04_04460 [Bdellovibrionales bacterium]|nr:hypothetical protein [Bdellovibrionales bacterium]